MQTRLSPRSRRFGLTTCGAIAIVLACASPLNARRADPAELLSEAERWVLRGEVMRAISAYSEVETLNAFFKIGAGSWNRLCWYGALWGYAEDVLDACEKAVNLAPDNYEILDSRGLARALTGDFEGAIEDFEVFAESTEDERRRVQRREWVEMLRRGENPFTEETLQLLFFD